MRFFTYELLEAANDWIDQTEAEHRAACARFERTVEDYQNHLEGLRSRLSQAAWRFFRHGRERYSLHDGQLLRLSIGDGLDYEADGRQPFRLNNQRMALEVEFLSDQQDLHYCFRCRGVRRIVSELFTDPGSLKSIGDLYTYECIALDEEYLGLNFLFASGAEIAAECRKVVFRRRRLGRMYAADEMLR